MIDPIEARVEDNNAEALGVPGSQLMENAGKAAAELIMTLSEPSRVVVICGTGNNGGDGAVIARYLDESGWRVTLALVKLKSNIHTHISRSNFDKIPNSIEVIENANPEILTSHSFVVDAMLGIGLKSIPREPYATWIRKMNQCQKKIISIDVPSGLGTELAVKPFMTLAMHDSKTGMTQENSGQIKILDIGIPKEAREFVGPGDMLFYPIPKQDSHKGQNGHLLIIGGGPYTGAPALSAFAAHAIGADLVTIATPEAISSTIASYSPNFIVRPLPGNVLTTEHVELLAHFIEDESAVLIGPGLGREPETVEAVRKLLPCVNKPLVIDADGLFAMTGQEVFETPTVLTPHRREFGRLGQGDNEVSVYNLAGKLSATIILKKQIDIISDGKRIKKNATGNPGMTVGGTGDVLAGIVGGLLSKGATPFEAARMGTFMSGQSGDMAFQQVGYSMTATDVIACIPAVLSRNLGRLTIFD